MNFQVENDHHFHSFSIRVGVIDFWLLRWQPWTFGQCLESILANGFPWFPVVQIRQSAGVLALLCLCFLLRWSHLLCGAADQTFCEGKPTRGSPEGDLGGLASGLVDWSTGHAIMKQDGTGATSHQVPLEIGFLIGCVFWCVQWNLRRFLCSIFFRDIMRYPWRYPPVTNCRAGTSQRIFHGELVQSPYHLKHHQKMATWRVIWRFPKMGVSHGTHPIHPIWYGYGSIPIHTIC